MSEYISTIIYICVFCIILELILPENKLKKYIGVLVSLVIILTLISPVLNLFESESVVVTISNAVDSIKSKMEVKEYNFSNMKNKIILSSTKENIQKDILFKCKEKFTKYNISKVKIRLTEDYLIEDVDIYVKNLPEVRVAGEIIDYVSGIYNIQSDLINVIKENQ